MAFNQFRGTGYLDDMNTDAGTYLQQKFGIITPNRHNENISPPGWSKTGRYTREEIDFWRERFKEINTSGDRYIEPFEIIKSAKEDGFEMSDEEAKEWIDTLDENHDGKVSFSEFIKAFGELKNKQ
ncbi:hypothetical protein BDV32DRAFT_148585 [Aspergillus pseudonomiae]|uniref:Uncharacterized protein n=1 Tax=Aspergillus pseudonomiae TaxID=1506151 RepID=A0A5N6I5J6_9EURO|nr:uncharacterized protein BDV37DRAFT_277696 [Aspergillus pseudonomiae]KAB8261317.1 hypothetical protein BDV32DRAFT_148585 [Aspergillus pseudonomiae]KAE8410052.1 hypothetical protein BDV37DRAFT_277696 [Aspergillus pseudonomiae]